MRKEFQIGISPENDTEYYASAKEYHVYASDTTRVSDSRYAAMRGNTPEKEFCVFVLIKNKKNVTIENCIFGKANTHLRLQSAEGS